ncbi:MAG: 5-(carboxyamino)imidazole ribonucleotide synthase [Chitinophagaceae bacterium]|nr:5-(carboxyamino)imidazole ribonucleotide synthase [Chitinophagaceae bacterium]
MIKAGILGGGQLGRMLLQEAANYPVETWVLENDAGCPAAHLCHHFVKGDIRDYEAVLSFGRQVDCLTIEIEHVNVEALEQLELEGIRIYPRPATLRIIQDKILQKEFYARHSIPTAEFHIIRSAAELASHHAFLPAVQKLGKGGYDGRGVQMIRRPEDIALGFDAPSVLEKLIPVKKELALMVALNNEGEAAIFPPVEMVFDPLLNLLDYQLCPAELPEKTFWKAEAIALSVARNLQSPGLFAVELLMDAEQNIFVNETAPRVHNSGHHTIEAHYSSQFDMLWRIMLDYPLGNTDAILPSAMLNLLGEEGYKGRAVYEGIGDCLAVENAFVHIYGKEETKPGRKMGHVTIISKERAELLHQARKIKHTLKVKGTESIK